MRPYFPGGKLNGFPTILHNPEGYATPSLQRLLLGLLGYLIRIAPLAFVPHCQTRSSRAPSPQVVLLGLSHFTATLKILLTPPGPKFTSVFCNLFSLAEQFHKRFDKPATDALGPINVIATCGAGVTAAAGTSLSHHLFAKVFNFGKSLT